MRWISISGSIILALVTGLTAEGPPSVPVSRVRPRLVHRSWRIEGRLYQPFEMADAALADILLRARVDTPLQLQYYRYFTLYNYPRSMRIDVYKELTFVINSLSSKPDIVLPAFGGPANTLVRVNLLDYGIDPEVFDRICQLDPYFHQIIEQTDVITEQVPYIEKVRTGRYWHDRSGQIHYETRDVTKYKAVTTTTDPIKKTASAAWLNKDTMIHLIKLTQAKSPITRADWFIVNATLPPNYYDLLGVKTLDEFKDLAIFDKRAKIREAAATIVWSGSDGLANKVRRNNAILVRFPTLLGYWWETFDYFNSIDKQNVVTNFLNRKRDGGEVIASLPNGLQAYFLVNGKDERVNEVPIKIAVDAMAHDARVINGRSCIWCHANGINAFRSHFQVMIGPKLGQSNLGIYDKDPRKALQLQQDIRRVFGNPNFSAVVRDDQALYAKAIRACNNLVPEANASLYKQIYDGYAESRLDMPRIVYEVGLPAAEIKALIPLRVNGLANGVLSQQSLIPPVAIRRDHWEEAFPQMMLLTMLRRAKK